jgi:hypothetical protein
MAEMHTTLALVGAFIVLVLLALYESASAGRSVLDGGCGLGRKTREVGASAARCLRINTEHHAS